MDCGVDRDASMGRRRYMSWSTGCPFIDGMKAGQRARSRYPSCRRRRRATAARGWPGVSRTMDARARTFVPSYAIHCFRDVPAGIRRFIFLRRHPCWCLHKCIFLYQFPEAARPSANAFVGPRVGVIVLRDTTAFEMPTLRRTRILGKRDYFSQFAKQIPPLCRGGAAKQEFVFATPFSLARLPFFLFL